MGKTVEEAAKSQPYPMLMAECPAQPRNCDDVILNVLEDHGKTWLCKAMS